MDSGKLKSYSHIYMHNTNSRVKLWFFVCAGVFLIFLFLPWTQNIRAKRYCNNFVPGPAATTGKHHYWRKDHEMAH